jgi:3-oxoacyl-[acyl-carrier-protein] synthase-3
MNSTASAPQNPNTPPRYTRITGTGSCLPPRRVTNAQLAAELATQGVETSDEWIVERTGIRARHFVD